MVFRFISETDVDDVKTILNPSKFSGPVLIIAKLLKDAAIQLKQSICQLFNLSLSAGVFPSYLKTVHGMPVYKISSNGLKKHRSISLLSVISKCMERNVYKSLLKNEKYL